MRDFGGFDEAITSGGTEVELAIRTQVAHEATVVTAPDAIVHSRTVRGLVSELELTAAADSVPTDCVANFDNIHTIPRTAFRQLIIKLEPPRLAETCQRLRDATGC